MNENFLYVAVYRASISFKAMDFPLATPANWHTVKQAYSKANNFLDMFEECRQTKLIVNFRGLGCVIVIIYFIFINM